jgi:hypothetical protein
MVSPCAFHHDLAAGRRADRPAVERDGKTAIGLVDGSTGVEPLALRRAGRAPHGLLRIERGFPRHFIE